MNFTAKTNWPVCLQDTYLINVQSDEGVLARADREQNTCCDDRSAKELMANEI